MDFCPLDFHSMFIELLLDFRSIVVIRPAILCINILHLTFYRLAFSSDIRPTSIQPSFDVRLTSV